MSVMQEIVAGVQDLPAEKQQEILEHVKRLRAEAAPRRRNKSVRGLWKDLNVSISSEDIDEMRKEAWKNFPREFPQDGV